MNISQSDMMRFSFVHTEKHCASASVSGPSWKVIQTTGETSCSVQSGGKQCLLAYQYQEKSSHVCPKKEDKSDHSATLNPHPCSWWWSPRPCRRRARLDLSGRWRSGRGWWRRAWRGCCLRRSAPGYESWPHRRRWWSTCRCRWCSAWGQREEQSQRERENQQLRTSRDDSEQVVSTADCVGDAVTSEAKCCVRPQAEVFNSLQTQRGFHRPRDVCFTTNAPASQTRSEQKKVQDIEISVNVMWHKSSEWLRNVIGLEGV